MPTDQHGTHEPVQLTCCLPACHADDNFAAARFPHESSGIKKFYDECWAVFNALNSLELKSLEEPRWGQLGATHRHSA